VGVDVRLADINNSGNATITARVRANTIAGVVVAEATKALPQDLLGGAEWVRFDFPAPVVLTPGSLYVLELDSTNASHAWSSAGGGNPYPGGRAILSGSPSATNDFAFHTYACNAVGDVDCNGIVNSVDALKVLRFVAGLSVTQTEPCPDISQLP